MPWSSWSWEFQRIHSPIPRYGFSVASVAIALGVALALQHYQFRGVEVPVLAVAIAFTSWYAGDGPSVLAVLLSTACFDYFFADPIYSFDVSVRDLPYFIIFVAWAAIVASFSAVRRRIEDSLRQARDNLQVEVEQRRQREDEIRDTKSGTQQTGRGTRSHQQGIGSRLPIPSPTTCGRHFATWSDTRSCCKDRHRLCLTRRVSGLYERFSTQQKEWAI